MGKNVIWDQWEQQVDVNAKGTMHGIGTVLPKMLGRGKGHIVNITSDAGRKAFAGLGIYSGSKFFVEAVSQALRAETASSGLRVTLFNRIMLKRHFCLNRLILRALKNMVHRLVLNF